MCIAATATYLASIWYISQCCGRILSYFIHMTLCTTQSFNALVRMLVTVMSLSVSFKTSHSKPVQYKASMTCFDITVV